jgi:hypothetical protein
MELSNLPIQEQILSTIYQEKNMLTLHKKLNGIVDEYGWQYPHYLVSIDFNSYNGKKNTTYFSSILDHLIQNPELLNLKKEQNDNFLLLEQDNHIQIVAREEVFYPGEPKTAHLLPLFLNMYARETKEFDITKIDWTIQDSCGLNPFFYALHFDCQYFIINYVKNEVPFFNHEQLDHIKLYEEKIEKNDLPNKSLIKTLFEKYKLEAMISENTQPQRKYKI